MTVVNVLTGQRVLITGGNGFLGRHLRASLTECGMDVHYTFRREGSDLSGPGRAHLVSLQSTAPLGAFLTKLEPDFVIHLASLAKPSRSLEDFDAQYVNTIEPAVTVARAVPESVKLTVFVGSCEEYGTSEPPFREDQLPHIMSPYGWGKIAAHHGVEYIARMRALRWCWIRPFLTFGPDQDSASLVPTLIRKCIAGEVVELTPGEQTRDFVYIADLCRMFESVLAKPERAVGEVINFCSGAPVTIRAMAEEIQALVGNGALHFGALPYRINEAMRFYGSSEKFTRLFGEPLLTPRARALGETLAAYRA